MPAMIAVRCAKVVIWTSAWRMRRQHPGGRPKRSSERVERHRNGDNSSIPTTMPLSSHRIARNRANTTARRCTMPTKFKRVVAVDLAA
jgi:hypothetical protein